MPDVWPFIPMPESRETLQFSTDVQETYSSEMRYSLRGGRQYLTYKYRKTYGLQKMAQKFRNNPYGEWLVPVWEQVSAIGAVASADTSIAADPDAEYDGSVLIWGGCENYVVATVSSVGSAVNLSAPVGQDFSKAVAIPLRTCLPTDGASLTRIDSVHSEVIIEWLATSEFSPSGASYSAFGGFPYLPCATAVVKPLSGSIIHPTEKIDSDLGPVVLAPTRSLIEGVYAISINESGRSEIANLRKFLGDMRGQDAAFWIADWEGKLRLTSSLSPGATTASFAPILEDVADYVGRYVLFDGEYKEITGSFDLITSHQISFSALAGASAGGRLLRKVRMNGDRFVFNHRRGLASSVDFTAREAA